MTYMLSLSESSNMFTKVGTYINCQKSSFSQKGLENKAENAKIYSDGYNTCE